MMETADGLMLCSVARYNFVGTRSLLAAVISLWWQTASLELENCCVYEAVWLPCLFWGNNAEHCSSAGELSVGCPSTVNLPASYCSSFCLFLGVLLRLATLAGYLGKRERYAGSHTRAKEAVVIDVDLYNRGSR